MTMKNEEPLQIKEEGKVSGEVTDKYSLRGRVFNRIREDILSGKYRENEELKEVTIGNELGVSRTPVREALRQLELEGLVNIIPNKGAYVTGISQKTFTISMLSVHILKDLRPDGHVRR